MVQPPAREPATLLLYYITDRSQFAGTEAAQRSRLLRKIHESAVAGVDFIQLREKNLSTRELELLACDALGAVEGSKTRLLVNSRSDVALACGAHGVHLRSDDISAAEARLVAKGVGSWLVFVSCHSTAEVSRASEADLAIFAPVFEKKESRPAGIQGLREACQFGVPVIALGGVTVANTRSCIEAGAAGVAGIRLFQESDVAQVVKMLS